MTSVSHSLDRGRDQEPVDNLDRRKDLQIGREAVLVAGLLPWAQYWGCCVVHDVAAAPEPAEVPFVSSSPAKKKSEKNQHELSVIILSCLTKN